MTDGEIKAYLLALAKLCQGINHYTMVAFVAREFDHVITYLSEFGRAEQTYLLSRIVTAQEVVMTNSSSLGLDTAATILQEAAATIGEG